jgi:hypothetical protein
MRWSSVEGGSAEELERKSVQGGRMVTATQKRGPCVNPICGSILSQQQSNLLVGAWDMQAGVAVNTRKGQPQLAALDVFRFMTED